MTRTLAVRTLAAIFALIAIPLATTQQTVAEDDGGAAAILVLANFAIVIFFLAI